MKAPKDMTDDDLLDEVCDLIRQSRVSTYDRKRFLAVANELKDRGFKF